MHKLDGFVLALFVSGLLTYVAVYAEAPRVGVFKDRRSCEIEGVIKTLEAEGFAAQVITKADLREPEKLKELRVIYLPAGWNAYQFADFRGRGNLVDFVAQGKGILSGAFRSGWYRTSNRPLFPQVGYTYAKNNGMFLFPRGDSPLVTGFDEPYCVDNFDHMPVRTGPKGKVFAVDSAGLPVGVYGEVFGGRYVILGCFISPFSKEELAGLKRTVFMNCIRWLGQAPARTANETEQDRQAAELDFLRRERYYDWLLDEAGPDRNLGALPQIRNGLEMPLLSRRWRLEYTAEHLVGEGREAALRAEGGLQRALDRLRRNYEAVAKAKELAIKSASRSGLAKDHPVLDRKAVSEKVAALVAAAEDDGLKRLAAGIARGRVDPGTMKAVLKLFYGAELRERMLPDNEMPVLLAEADKTLAELAPKAEEARRKAMAETREREARAVPALIQQCSARDSRVRGEAVRELGRIGDPRAIKALIGLVDDEDRPVRTHATQALAWMRAKEAVPKLIKATESEDKWDRRRAVQALGQIGDQRAAQTLLKATADSDYHVRENAVLALGWLGAKAAVEPLLKLVKEGDREEPYERELMLAAMRALGHIGDERARPMLEHWAKTADDYPNRGGRGTHKNIYAISGTLGLQGQAELALEEIEAGGRTEAGVRQHPGLASRDRFYGLQKNFNFLAGRPLDYVGGRYFKDDLDGLFACIRSGGGTGICCGWDVSRYGYEPEEYRQIVKLAGEYGLLWIDTMPTPSDGFRITREHPYKRQMGNGNILSKPGAEVSVLAYEDLPGFHGFWSEETWPHVSLEDPVVQEGFKAYLERKYGRDFRKVLALEPGVPLVLPKAEDREEHRRLWAEYLSFGGESIAEEWREGQEWLAGLRKGCAFTFSISSAMVMQTYIGDCGKVGGVIQGFGPQKYTASEPNTTLMMELAKDGEPRAVLCEFYNWYDPSPRHGELGFAKHLMHGECFFSWGLEMIFKKPASYPWYWNPELWDLARKTFRKAQRLKGFLAGAGSAANAALIASERTDLLLYSEKIGETVRFPRRYYQQLLAFWVALQQSHVPADAIWAETLTAEKLGRYELAVLPDAKSLTPEQVQVIRDWVRQGGALIATGTTSLFNQWGEQQANYALADVFGVDYRGYAGRSDPKESDTFCFVSNREPPRKVVDEGLDPANFRWRVHREVRPSVSLDTYGVGKASELLPQLPEGFTCEYDMPLGYDKVKAREAEVLATWPSGAPALTVHAFGKGVCYLWTPIYPGLCHRPSEFVYTPHFFDFWPGVRELLEAMVRGGLGRVGASLPVQALSCPKDVEVTVRKQPKKRRWIVHLLNYDTNTDKIRGVGLIVRPPELKDVRVFYPDTDETVGHFRSAGGVEFSVRDFTTHEMVVVEY